MRKGGAEKEQHKDDIGPEITARTFCVSLDGVATAIAIASQINETWTYPGILPFDSVRGTKISGHTAAPMFHDTVAQIVLSKGLFSTLNWLEISEDPEP